MVLLIQNLHGYNTFNHPSFRNAERSILNGGLIIIWQNMSLNLTVVGKIGVCVWGVGGGGYLAVESIS